MTNDMQHALLDSGFVPPDAWFSKQDPRGGEYGYYKAAEVVSCRAGTQELRVRKYSRSNNLQWCCTFDDPAWFVGWARDNT